MKFTETIEIQTGEVDTVKEILSKKINILEDIKLIKVLKSRADENITYLTFEIFDLQTFFDLAYELGFSRGYNG